MLGKAVSIAGRLRATAFAVALAMLAITAYTAKSYYDSSIDQRLIATRAVVQQSLAIAQKFHDLEKSGALPAAEARLKAQGEIKAIRYEGKEYVWINDMTPRMIAHPIKPELDGKDLSANVDPNGKHLFVEFVNVVRASGSGYVDYLWPKPGSQQPEPKRSYVAGFAPWGWVVGSGVYVDEIRDAALRFGAVSLALGLAFSACVFGFMQALARSLQKRLAQAETALAAIADGRLDAPVEAGRADEIGRLMLRIGQTRDSLRQIMRQVRESTDQIATASSEIASGNQDLSLRTEQTASNLQQTASSMEHLTRTVTHSADAAHNANQLVGSASAVAARGGAVVSQVVATMSEIDDRSKKIADIISTIDGIAFQTNILALNAAVEAARAGEEGRGFAVVAGEVRGLAQRSAAAAKEIKSLIGASVEKVATGTQLVHDAGATMAEIVESVRRVTAVVGEITSTSSEQSAGIGEINASVTQLDAMTQQNSALVEQSAAAAESLKAQAARLAGLVATFRLDARTEPAALTAPA